MCRVKDDRSFHCSHKPGGEADTSPLKLSFHNVTQARLCLLFGKTFSCLQTGYMVGAAWHTERQGRGKTCEAEDF